MRLSRITLNTLNLSKKGPRARGLSGPHWWLAVLGTSLIVFLSACGGASSTQHTASRPKIHVVPLSEQTLSARTDAQTMIQQLQQAISQAEQRHLDMTPYQLQLNEDRLDYQNAETTQAYNHLATEIAVQNISLKKEVTRYDLQDLYTLIGTTDINNDYEYRDAVDAYLNQQANFQSAQTLDDFQQVDTQTQTLLTNLNALLTNMNDPTAHDQPHATDLQLMQTYHLTGKVIMVSLTEQTLREYDNGKLVGWMYIVTGQRAAQSPPGLWNVQWKQQNMTFKSDDPKGSALWYPPTHINYALSYHDDGYFLHDATWRSYFGPGANLPHDDYTSGQYSDTGTHGCINMTLGNARDLYYWADVGTPVVVY